MSTSEDPQILRMVQNLHRQAIDAHTEGKYEQMESLLEEAIKNLHRSIDSDSLGRANLPLIVKENFWLAHSQQMQGNYSKAMETYNNIIVTAPEVYIENSQIDDKILWCIAGAFMYYAECGGKSSPPLAVKDRLDVLGKGSAWLFKIGKIEEWSAGLHLQQGLLLKEQNNLDGARKELRQALKLACEYHFAPGYNLATYRLELAELLCASDTPEDYKEAADLARQVLLTEGNDAHDRWRAYKTLVYARLEQGKMAAHGSQTYIMETGSDVYHFLVPLHQEIEQVSNVITDLSQIISTLFNEVTSRSIHLDAVIKDFENLIGRVDTLTKNQAEQLDSIQKLSDSIQVNVQHKNEQIKTFDDQQQDQVKHIKCLVAMPVNDDKTFAYETVLLRALRTVLEQEPYYWQVARTNEQYIAETKELSVVQSMIQARAFVADISDRDPDVMMELGYMRWGKKSEQPLILLQRESTNHSSSHLDGFIRIAYPDARGDHAIGEIAKVLQVGFAKHEAVRKLNDGKLAHYLSPLLLSSAPFNVTEDIAKKLSEAYTTVESFVGASPKDIINRVPGYNRKMADTLRQVVAEHFRLPKPTR